MQIEHITLGGNSTLRDSAGIFPETIEALKDFQMKEGSKTIDLIRTDLKVKVSATKEGAMFDIMKGGNLGITNICCFNDEYTNMMFDMVKHLHDIMKFGDPRLPVLHNWIYSILIDPITLGFDGIQIAGEVELYIYYSLYLARK